MNSCFEEFFHRYCSQNFISLVYVLAAKANEPNVCRDGLLNFVPRRLTVWISMTAVSMIDTPGTKIGNLSLRELESLTGALLTVFLTLFLTRVAGDQSGLLQ